MPAHPETTTAKLKSAISTIIATVAWLASVAGLYACWDWLTPEPFATEAECHRALAYLEQHDGPPRQPEWCAELERGGWCAFAYDPGSGTDRCFMP
jgi:hypothetical protein